MKKIVKCFVSVLIVTVVTISSSATAFASKGKSTESGISNGSRHGEIMEMLQDKSAMIIEGNEYVILKNINKQYRIDLSRGNIKKYSTISGESRNTIINYRQEYIDKIYMLQNWSDEELKFVGYDQIQISAIRNFDGSEEMIERAATTVTVNAGFRNKVYSSSTGTKVDLIVSFNSKGIQSNWWNDLFCVTWSQPLTVSSCEGYVEYRDTYYQNSETISHSPRAAGIYAREIEFSKYTDNSKYVYAGSMIVHLKSNTKVSDFAAYAAYGYSGLAVTGVSASYPGGLSISFGVGMSKAGSAYASL